VVSSGSAAPARIVFQRSPRNRVSAASIRASAPARPVRAASSRPHLGEPDLGVLIAEDPQRLDALGREGEHPAQRSQRAWRHDRHAGPDVDPQESGGRARADHGVRMKMDDDQDVTVLLLGERAHRRPVARAAEPSVQVGAAVHHPGGEDERQRRAGQHGLPDLLVRVLVEPQDGALAARQPAHDLDQVPQARRQRQRREIEQGC
jgi:hypothetical protein